MCGIAGFVGKGDLKTLEEMVSTITYRGPDDKGYFFKDGVGLGFRRLSIIDIKGGHQPMTNEDGSIILICNGEIYNFTTLRDDLVKHHTFISQSDIEVIIHLYEDLGEEVFTKLDGMFAIALWDRRKNKLIVARDRLGKKPLYYSHFASSFIFGSEPKSILKHPIIEKRVSPQSVLLYAVYEYIPTPYSIFQNIHKLEPGSYGVFSNNTFSIHSFWKIPPKPSIYMTESQWLNGMEERINDSVAKRLVADVPLGIFLSGGLDSSSIAYYAQKNSIQPVHTYSIGFAENSYDETKYARLAADYLGTIHHEQQCTSSDAVNIYQEVFEKLDEPLADASIIPTYLLSQFAKQEITVALGGDGSDELLMGYPNFLAHRFMNQYKRLPAIFRSAVSSLSTYLPVSSGYFSFGFKINRFLKGMDYMPVQQDLVWRGSFSPDILQKLFVSEYTSRLDHSEGFKQILWRLKGFEHEDLNFQLSILYLTQYLPDDILVKVDRASMYNSLEVRTPFLDHTLVEYILAMPTNLKLSGLVQKYALKRIMKGKLPNTLLTRKKQGFAMPVSDWLRGPFKNRLLDLCSSASLETQGIFNPSYITSLIRNHMDHKEDNRKELWTILVFQEWYQNWYLTK